MSKKISNTIALSVLMVLTVTLAAVPAGAVVQATSVDVRGEVFESGTSPTHVPHTNGVPGWDAFNFAGFWYDLKEGKMSEVMTIDPTSAASLSGTSRTIDKDKLFYNSTMQVIQYKVAEANASNSVDRALDGSGNKVASGATNGQFYGKLGWFAQPYVALNGKPNKLAQLIIEQGTSSSEKKSLTVGDVWDIGGGWTLTAQSIDAKATPRQAWLVLSKDGVKKDDKVIFQGQTYTYTEKSIAGESDVPLFVTYVDSVFAGATSDMVQLRYTWAISTSVTEVKTSDTYGVFKVIDDGTGNAQHTIKLWNDESSVSLSTDSTNNLAGEMNFRVAYNDTVLRFYPVVDYQVGPTNITPPTTGTATSTPTNQTPVGNQTVTPTETPLGPGTPGVSETPVTTATPKPTPAFESVFAIAGLLAVAYLVLRQRK